MWYVLVKYFIHTCHAQNTLEPGQRWHNEFDFHFLNMCLLDFHHSHYHIYFVSNGTNTLKRDQEMPSISVRSHSFSEISTSKKWRRDAMPTQNRCELEKCLRFYNENAPGLMTFDPIHFIARVNSLKRLQSIFINKESAMRKIFNFMMFWAASFLFSQKYQKL